MINRQRTNKNTIKQLFKKLAFLKELVCLNKWSNMIVWYCISRGEPKKTTEKYKKYILTK